MRCCETTQRKEIIIWSLSRKIDYIDYAAIQETDRSLKPNPNHIFNSSTVDLSVRTVLNFSLLDKRSTKSHFIYRTVAYVLLSLAFATVSLLVIRTEKSLSLS